ncbi:hypothetical protein ACFVUS_11165 [Nocardia sp. NPDC058058]
MPCIRTRRAAIMIERGGIVAMFRTRFIMTFSGMRGTVVGAVRLLLGHLW